MLYHLLVAVAGSALMLALVSAALWALRPGGGGGDCNLPAGQAEPPVACRACGMRPECHQMGDTI